MTDVLPVGKAGKLSPALDVHIEKQHTLFVACVGPARFHHLRDAQGLVLKEEVLDEFVADHVRIIPSHGSLVQKILKIFARL